MLIPKYQKEESCQFYVIAGSFGDLSLFDFTPYNVRCLGIESEELETLLKDMSDDQISRTSEVLSEYASKFGDIAKPYVFLPADFTAPYEESKLTECYRIILTLFPGDVCVCYFRTPAFRFKIFSWKRISRIWFQIIYLPNNRNYDF